MCGRLDPKPGHAISDTYTEEETGAPADCTEPLAVSGDLFGAAPKPARKAKTAKPIKRVFNITLTEPARSPSSAFGTHGSGRIEHTLRRSPWLPPNPMNSSPKSTTGRTPASLQHLDIEEAQCRKPLRHGVRRQLPPGEHGSLILANMLQPKLVGRTMEVPREVLDGADVSAHG
jgi:hypothetical protein